MFANWKCSLCNVYFTSHGTWKCHVEDMHHVCPKVHCNAVFCDEDIVQTLLARHKGKFKCSQCLKRYLFRSALMHHVLNHAELRTFVYREAGCGCSFKHKAELTEHCNVHHISDSPTYFCTECSYQGKSMKCLTEHSYLHQPPRYKCHCGQTFRYRPHLYRHTRKFNH